MQMWNSKSTTMMDRAGIPRSEQTMKTVAPGVMGDGAGMRQPFWIRPPLKFVQRSPSPVLRALVLIHLSPVALSAAAVNAFASPHCAERR